MHNFYSRSVLQLLKQPLYSGLQILEETAGALTASDVAIRQAAEWIYDRAFGGPEFEHLAQGKDARENISRQIANVLHFIHDDKFEVCFLVQISPFDFSFETSKPMKNLLPVTRIKRW